MKELLAVAVGVYLYVKTCEWMSDYAVRSIAVLSQDDSAIDPVALQQSDCAASFYFPQRARGHEHTFDTEEGGMIIEEDCISVMCSFENCTALYLVQGRAA